MDATLSETTATTRPRLVPLWLLRLLRGRAADPAWARPAILAVLAAAALLYVWNLTVSGYANTYYSAAAMSGAQSWSAWFFGSFDASNFITVDKPPLSTMVMGLSVRVFGLSAWSILLPEALMGVTTVGVLFAAVRRSFGPAAAVIAAATMALTPAAAMIFRFNNPDALLTLLLVCSAWALLRSLAHGGYRWVALASALVGLAFLTKYLQAYLVLPGYALVFAISADSSARRRIGGLALAAVSVLVASGWWVAIVEAIPAASRPFVGGSATGSPLDLIFGYDGLGRIFGGAAGPGSGGGANFSGDPGILRLFDDQFFGEIAWLVPLALAGLALGLWRRRRAGRTDPARAGYLLWGAWLLVTAATFSFMSGIVHSYYAVALAPAVAALAGAGLSEMWRLRGSAGRVVVGLACLGEAAFCAALLARTPAFAPGLGMVALVIAAAALLVMVVVSTPALALRPAARKAASLAAVAGIAAVLLAPAAYSLDTTTIAYGGGDPHPGPGAAAGGPRQAGLAASADGGAAPASLPAFGPAGGPGGPQAGVRPAAAQAQAPAGLPGDGGGVGGDTADKALLDYLVSNRGKAVWIVAAHSAQDAGSIELATGLPVMAMGGFTGSDPAPTLDQFKAYVASGDLRFVLSGSSGGGPGGGVSDVSSWVAASCKVVDYGGSSSLYDCAAAGQRD